MLKETQIFDKEEEANFANSSFVSLQNTVFKKNFAEITLLIYVTSDSGTANIYTYMRCMCVHLRGSQSRQLIHTVAERESSLKAEKY